MLSSRISEQCTDQEYEVRQWFAEGGELGGDGFLQHDRLDFVDALYRAGSPRVTVRAITTTRRRELDGSWRELRHADLLVVAVPAEPEARARIFAIYNAEVDDFGEDFGGEETRGHEMTHEEALTIGQPDAEGEWVVDDLHLLDEGQAEVKFWWD